MAAKKAPAKKMAAPKPAPKKTSSSTPQVLQQPWNKTLDRGNGVTEMYYDESTRAKMKAAYKADFAKKQAFKSSSKPKSSGAAGSSKMTPAQQRAMASANKNRKDKYGLSGFGETKAGVTAKDMAKINKGRGKFDKKMPIEEMITPRGNVRGYMGVYDNPAKAKAAAAKKKK
jgi:hypothetical protein